MYSKPGKVLQGVSCDTIKMFEDQKGARKLGTWGKDIVFCFLRKCFSVSYKKLDDFLSWWKQSVKTEVKKNTLRQHETTWDG